MMRLALAALVLATLQGCAALGRCKCELGYSRTMQADLTRQRSDLRTDKRQLERSLKSCERYLAEEGRAASEMSVAELQALVGEKIAEEMTEWTRKSDKIDLPPTPYNELIPTPWSTYPGSSCDKPNIICLDNHSSEMRFVIE